MSRKQRGAPGWVLHQAWAGLEVVEGVELCPPSPRDGQSWGQVIITGLLLRLLNSTFCCFGVFFFF